MEYITLKDIAIINMGQSPDSKTYNEEKEGIPFYQGKSDFGKINPIPRVWCSNPIKIAEKEDILISVRAPIGDTNIATERCCIGRGLASIRPLNENVNQKYLYYLLNSKYKELNKFGTGSTFKAITKDNLCNLKCTHIPDIKEQIEVVNKLDNVSKIIAIKKEQLEQLNTIIKSQFVEMFGNVNDNKNSYEIKTLSEVFEFIKDGTHSTPTYTDDKINGIKFLSAKDVTKGIINWENIKYIPLELHEQLVKRVKPQKDDILLAKNGTTGVCAKVDRDEIFDIYVSLALLRPKEGYLVDYLVQAINNDMTKEQFDRSLKGVGVPNLHLGEIQKVKIIVPPIKLQNKFADIVKQIDKQKFESMIKAKKEIVKIQKNIFYKWGR